MENTPEQRPNSTASLPLALALVGGAFVFLAIAGLIGANWGNISPVFRVLLVVSPVIGLYLAGFAAMNTVHNKTLGVIVTLVAHASFPFALGVILRTFTSLTALDTALVTLVAAVSTLWYGVWQISNKVILGWWFTILAALTWTIGLLDLLSVDPFYAGLITFALGALGLMTAGLLQTSNRSRPEINAYLWSGMVSMFISMAVSLLTVYGVLPVDYSDTVKSLLIHVLGFIVSIILILFAVYAAKNAPVVDQKDFDITWLQVRYSLENAAIFIWGVSLIATLVQIDSYSTGTDIALVLVCLPVSIVLAALFARSTALRPLRIGVVVAAGLFVAKIISILLAEIVISSQFIILLVGLVLIGTAFAVNTWHVKNIQMNKGLRWFTPDLTHAIGGLGLPLPVEQLHLRAPMPSGEQSTTATWVAHDPRHSNTAFETGLKVLGVLIGGFIMLSIVIRAAFGGY
jgi:hypothetical protein